MENWLKNILFFTTLLILSIFLMKYLFILFTPFIIAVVLASLINPLVDRLEKLLPLDRGFAVFIVLLLLISILTLFLIIGLSQIYLELNRLLKNLPDYSKLQWIINQNNRLEDLINNLEISPQAREALNDNLQLVYNTIKNAVTMVINNVLNIIKKLPLILSVLFLSFIATFFICRDKDLINDFIMGLFPAQLKAKVYKVEKELLSSTLNFIRAELILISITGVIAGTGLALLGSPYALIIGVFSALLDLIPLIGPALIFLPWIIFNFFSGEIQLAFSLLLVYTLMAAVRQGAEAKVMGSQMGFHPLVTMITLYVGYRLLGPIGFLIGPAILVLGKTILNTDIRFFKE